MDIIAGFLAMCGDGLVAVAKMPLGLPAALLLSGLAGSLVHCVGMCGPFVLGQVMASIEQPGDCSYGEWHRLTGALLVLLLVSLLAFGIIWLVPGDPTAILLDASATPEQAARLRAQLGLDRPFLLQMAEWYGRLLHGDLGQSILLNRSVAAALIERLPVTLSIAGFALVLAVVLGVSAGIVAAVYHNRWPDQVVMASALFSIRARKRPDLQFATMPLPSGL